MLDFMIRGISDATAAHIKALARDRNWSLNDVLLDLIERGLQVHAGRADDVVTPTHQDIARLGGTWDAAEAAAFRAAMQAIESLSQDDSLPDKPPKT